MPKEIPAGAVALVLHPADNVATVLRDLPEGFVLTVQAGERTWTVCLRERINFGHKLALEEIPRGGLVRKYGEVIGRATADIPAGAHVHVHNVESLRGRGDLHRVPVEGAGSA